MPLTVPDRIRTTGRSSLMAWPWRSAASRTASDNVMFATIVDHRFQDETCAGDDSLRG
jgi:hypothetical protein